MAAGLFILSRDPGVTEQLRKRFSPHFEVVSADSLETAPAQLTSTPIQAAVVHLSSGLFRGHSPQGSLQHLQELLSTAPIYGLIDPACPAEIRDQGAKMLRGCLPMPVDLDQLETLVENHVELAAELAQYYSSLPHRALRGQTRTLVTFTPSMFEMFDELKVAAQHDVTVLLIGETGCGKTYLARMIHEMSSRAPDRCLTVACGALPPDLIESELFGYVKGAFTGADCDKLGKFAAAERGTLLLDEIDVLAPDQQAKLLRVIETGEYEPVGSNDTHHARARLIVASNIDLEELVRTNKFRIDLFYRLNTLSFFLPPLRERPWDIEYLARKFAIDHSRAHRIELTHIDMEFIAALRQYRWPGNIRELENVIRRAVLYCRNGVLTVSDLPSALRCERPSRSPASQGVTVGGRQNGNRQFTMTLEDRVDEIERRIIEESLERHNHRRTDTAKELGISRVTLYNKMKKFGMLN
ncbi:MAG: sigma-54 dependent transcriptional regulator [Thermoguttaceae bacterium]